MLKRLMKSVLLVCVLALASIALPTTSNPMLHTVSAQDVWAYTDTYENFQAFVDTDTIQWNNDRTVLHVNVKEVRNNRLIYTERWHFYYYKGEWRSNTDSMIRAAKRKGIGARTEVLLQSNANILHICQQYS